MADTDTTSTDTRWQQLADALNAALEEERIAVRAAMDDDPDLPLERAIRDRGGLLSGFTDSEGSVGAMEVHVDAEELAGWPLLDDGGIWGPGHDQALALDRGSALMDLVTTAPGEPWDDIAWPIPDDAWASGSASSDASRSTLPQGRCEHGHGSIRGALDCAAERRSALGMAIGERETPPIIVARADGSPVLDGDADGIRFHWTHDPACPHRRGLSGRCRWCGAEAERATADAGS